jgi:hypothetical protein
MMSTPETPKTVRRNFDLVINRLNSCWDLQLPRIHGRVAELAENEGVLPRRITSRIRFLCFRPQLNLEALIVDFEEKAKEVKSNWVFKPQQESGTLPRLPKEKSKLFKESLAKPFQLTSSQREELLLYLDKLLDDEYQLSRDSPTYQRSSGDDLDKESGRDGKIRGRNPASTRTPHVTIPTTAPLAQDIVDAGMADMSSTVAVPNQRKRSPSGDAREVFSDSRLMACAADNYGLRPPSPGINDCPKRRDRLRLWTVSS